MQKRLMEERVLKAKLIRIVPEPEHSNYSFKRYEYECVDCGKHYFRKQNHERISPYCYDCQRKHITEKHNKKLILEEQQRISQVLEDIKSEITKLPFIHTELEYQGEAKKVVSVNEVFDIIDRRMKSEK